MKLSARVQAGAFRDGLWRDADNLLVQVRPDSDSHILDEYLVKFLSGSLRVAPSLIAITRGKTKNYRQVQVDVSDSDLKPILDALPPVPQARLFEQ